MKFLCLCRYDLAAFAALTPADFQEIGDICAPHDAALRDSGKVDQIGSLGMPHEARTLRPGDDGAVAVSDGPYRTEAEPVGAFFIVEAPDIAAAVAVARLHPGNHLGARFGGGIEVWPVGELWSAALGEEPSR